MPKLTEILIQILSDSPFHGVGSILVKDSTSMKFKGEMLLTTILNFTLRVLGTKLTQKRKVTIERVGDSEVKAGEKFEVMVRIQKFAFLKKNDHGKPRRIWLALVNMLDSSVQF